MFLTPPKRAAIRNRPGETPRVGFFGHVGACNIGNDASMEALLRYLRAEYPDTIVDAMCPGPHRVREQYGIDAIPMIWYHRYEEQNSGVPAVALKMVGRALDGFRIANWVRRHDVVMVPGAGVLEASLPLWPWGMPYALFMLSASGRLFGTKIAFVCVGAGRIDKRVTRWLSNGAARLAFYRSFRDAGAREAMHQRGLDTRHDHVYPDLAFALPQPGEPDDAVDDRLVGVGVMEYRGSNDERRDADAIYATYVSAMKDLVRRLVDSGRRVRLFVGDTNGSDAAVVNEILSDLRNSRPGLESSLVEPAAVTSFGDVLAAMVPVRSVIAMRFHNLVAALKLSKPTISISYSPKHDVLMSEMGLSGFSQSVNDLDVDRLMEQLADLETRSPELRQAMRERNAANNQLREDLFTELSALLFCHIDSHSDAAAHESAP